MAAAAPKRWGLSLSLMPITWPLFCFLSLFFLSPQVSRIQCWLVGDVWKVVLKRMSADAGCCSSAAPTFILPHALGCECELEARPCLVSVCLTRHKQNQCYSLIMFNFVGRSWSWLSRELLSVFIMRLYVLDAFVFFVCFFLCCEVWFKLGAKPVCKLQLNTDVTQNLLDSVGMADRNINDAHTFVSLAGTQIL